MVAGALLASSCSRGIADTTAPEGPSRSEAAVSEAGAFVGADGVAVPSPDTERIVTLSGDLTEFVFALGHGASVVATDVTTVEPEEAVGLPKIGVGRFLNAEAVLRQSPTLVIGDIQTAPSTAIEQIRAAGVPVAILDVPTTFPGLYEKVDDLGVLLEASDAADVLARRMQTDIAAASRALDDPATALRIAYVYTRGPDVMLLFGEGMTTTPLIQSAGGIDAGVAAGVVGTVDVTPEALAAAAPDVLIVPSEGYGVLGGLQGLRAIPGVAATPAGADGAVLAYPEGDFLTFGPRVAESIARLAADLSALAGTP
jgi:iron complex transport system substrate-binding protein